MSRICENCRRTVNSVHSNPYYLTNDKILCRYCVNPIREDIYTIYKIKSKEEYTELKERVITKSQKHFNKKIIQYISDYMDKRYNIIEPLLKN